MAQLHKKATVAHQWATKFGASKDSQGIHLGNEEISVMETDQVDYLGMTLKNDAYNLDHGLSSKHAATRIKSHEWSHLLYVFPMKSQALTVIQKKFNQRVMKQPNYTPSHIIAREIGN
eukprot:GHVP01026243.1.p1 GENE.GHVP01026243.1~~GHVP01026243.1.p1  ORF type:complete len:118 (+),score=11.81 GHVP01026243.1:362-715(+)